MQVEDDIGHKLA